MASESQVHDVHKRVKRHRSNFGAHSLPGASTREGFAQGCSVDKFTLGFPAVAFGMRVYSKDLRATVPST